MSYKRALPVAVVLLASLAALPACGKKKDKSSTDGTTGTVASSGGGTTTPAPAATASVTLFVPGLASAAALALADTPPTVDVSFDGAGAQTVSGVTFGADGTAKATLTLPKLPSGQTAYADLKITVGSDSQEAVAEVGADTTADKSTVQVTDESTVAAKIFKDQLADPTLADDVKNHSLPLTDNLKTAADLLTTYSDTASITDDIVAKWSAHLGASTVQFDKDCAANGLSPHDAQHAANGETLNPDNFKDAITAHNQVDVASLTGNADASRQAKMNAALATGKTLPQTDLTAAAIAGLVASGDADGKKLGQSDLYNAGISALLAKGVKIDNNTKAAVLADAQSADLAKAFTAGSPPATLPIVAYVDGQGTAPLTGADLKTGYLASNLAPAGFSDKLASDLSDPTKLPGGNFAPPPAPPAGSTPTADQYAAMKALCASPNTWDDTNHLCKAAASSTSTPTVTPTGTGTGTATATGLSLTALCAAGSGTLTNGSCFVAGFLSGAAACTQVANGMTNSYNAGTYVCTVNGTPMSGSAMCSALSAGDNLMQIAGTYGCNGQVPTTLATLCLAQKGTTTGDMMGTVGNDGLCH